MLACCIWIVLGAAWAGKSGWFKAPRCHHQNREKCGLESSAERTTRLSSPSPAARNICGAEPLTPRPCVACVSGLPFVPFFFPLAAPPHHSQASGGVAERPPTPVEIERPATCAYTNMQFWRCCATLGKGKSCYEQSCRSWDCVSVRRGNSQHALAWCL
jgi:hypothetical protein